MEDRELTVLFYFASDNPLAPLVISEIKAIKDAGFQKNTSVLVYFDPMEKNAPTQLFDVNRDRRNRLGTMIGDSKDPFVRNMAEDEVPVEDLSPKMREVLESPSGAVAFDSLTNFIDFALLKHKAKNYMLFLVGHGMVVGNDAFLPDDEPHSAITLSQLKTICEVFKQNDSQLRLLALHSCSMSSIEVAYQLRGCGDYMLATQGTAFVNGWPYRQMLKKTLNQVDRAKERSAAAAKKKQEEASDPEKPKPENNATVDYDELINKLYKLCMHNFTDFMNAGYSCDLVLCRLDESPLDKLKEPLNGLVSILKEELKPEVSIIKDLLLLAHWEAQSFWSENYTDLWDFCDRLAGKCKETVARLEQTASDDPLLKSLRSIITNCRQIQNILAPEDHRDRSGSIVRRADNCGTEFQFARGLSIYFPWCEPLDDQRATFKSTQDDTERPQREARSGKVLENYRNYDFTTRFGDDSWFTFLEAYFRDTKRELPDFQTNKKLTDNVAAFGFDGAEALIAFDKAEKTFLNGVKKRIPELKKSPEVGAGDCTCPTIKNYPTYEHPRLRRFSITPGALRAFIPKDDEEDDKPNAK